MGTNVRRSFWGGMSRLAFYASASVIAAMLTAGCQSDLITSDSGDGTIIPPVMHSGTSKDITFVEGSSRQYHKLKLYVPDGEGPFPVILYFGGSGFQEVGPGSGGTHIKQSYADSRKYAIAHAGAAGVGSTCDRPTKFDCMIEGALAAVRYLRANAATLKLDPNKFAVTGFSGGGYITNMVTALSNATHNFDNAALGNAGVSSAVQVGVSWAGLSDLGQLIAHAGSVGMHNQLAGGLIGCADLRTNCPQTTAANPLTYVSANTPPLFMGHGTGDNTVPWRQSEVLFEKYEQSANGKAKFNKNNGGHSDGVATTETEVWDFISKAFASVGPGPGPDPIEPPADGRWFFHPFEEPSNAQGWTNRGSSVTVSQTTDQKATGSGSLHVTGRAPTNNSHGVQYSLKSSEFVSGEKYSFSVTVMYPEGGETESVRLMLSYNSNQSVEIASVQAQKGKWVTFSNLSFTIPAGATNLVLYVEMPNNPTGAFYIDNAMGALEGVELPDGHTGILQFGRYTR